MKRAIGKNVFQKIWLDFFVSVYISSRTSGIFISNLKGPGITVRVMKNSNYVEWSSNWRKFKLLNAEFELGEALTQIPPISPEAQRTVCKFFCGFSSSHLGIIFHHTPSLQPILGHEPSSRFGCLGPIFSSSYNQSSPFSFYRTVAKNHFGSDSLAM